MTAFACDAVLFDCDGVLVDSDGPVIAAWTRWAADQGLDPDEVVSVVHGRRAADTVANLVPGAGQEAALALINRYELDAAHHVEAIPGARALTRSVPAGKWAVVTSGTTVLAQARLLAAGMPETRVLITADDVEQGKPHPAGYLAAARLLGVAPGACVVLEDAEAGIAAARAAGVAYVIGVGGRGLEGLADVVVPDLTGVSWHNGALEVGGHLRGVSLSESIFHITTAAAWEAARGDESFSAASPETEGFIHCSTAEQAAWVANSRFRGWTEPLVLLQLDPDALSAELKWESSEPDMPPFPHVYGPIDRRAVIRVIDFPEGPDGFTPPNG